MELCGAEKPNAKAVFSFFEFYFLQANLHPPLKKQ